MAMASGETNPESVTMQSDTSSSALVGAPIEVQTSGSVVRNSMTLLPTDGGIVKTQAARNSQVKSNFPAALAVNNAGPPSEAQDTSKKQGRQPTSRVDKASEDEQGLRLSNAPTDGGIVHTKSGDAPDGHTSCIGVVGNAHIEYMAPTPADNAPKIADANTMLIEAGVDTVHTIGAGAKVEQERDPGTEIEPVVDSPSQQDNTEEGKCEHTDSAIVEAGPEDTRAGRVGAIVCDARHVEGQGEVSPATVEVAEDFKAPTMEPRVGDGNEQFRSAQEVDKADDSLVEMSFKWGGASLQIESGTERERPQPLQPVDETPNGVLLCAGTEHDSGNNAERPCTLAVQEEASMSPCEESLEKRKAEENGRSGSDAVNREQVEVFLPSEKFTGSKRGYLFKLGDKGLGFYEDGYVDCPTKGKCGTSHRPWNAGPGKDAIRRGPMGPAVKPFTRFKTLRTVDGEAKKIADDSDSRPFMARMVAQRNSRRFQSTLLDRENALDAHILALLEKFADDPTFFKKKHGYNVHGQMLGKNGKMIVKERREKTEEEKAKLSWYRKVYEDRLGKQLPSKRLGDSIEARREAYAYSRYFTAELNGREDELNTSLAKALKGQTKLEFITEDYHYPGAYDTDGKVILEKGARASNELHQTEAQKERACSYRFKAIQRFRDAHDDIVGAVSKKDKALQKMIKQTDPKLLQEIADECVQSFGMGIHRQRNRTGQEAGQESSGALNGGPTESPEQLRDTFSQSLKAQIKGKDKALMKEVAALDEAHAEQMMEEFGKGVEILPGSWRQDSANLNNMQRRRKELIAEIAADRRKVVCPWRPGGVHIARGPWQSFIPRDHHPPTRSASEEKAGTGGASGAEPRHSSGDGPTRGSGRRKEGVPRRPNTAPTPRSREFMDTISARARRVLAAQNPGTPLHCAFSTYSTDPFQLDSVPGQRRGTVGSKAQHAASVFSLMSTLGGTSADRKLHTPESVSEGKQRAWVELSGSPTRPQHSSLGGGKGVARPQSAATETPNSRRVRVPPKRPSTASEARIPASARSGSTAAPATASKNSAGSPVGERGTGRDEGGEDTTNLQVRGGPGVTVLWARLCGPSDLVYKSSTWPSKPRAPTTSRHSRRSARTGVQSVTNPPGSSQTCSVESTWEQREPKESACTSADAVGDRRREGDVEHAETELGSENPLEDLEKGLVSSTWRRVHQRKRVFRGYADRARRERTWDPGSAFYADGASKHHTACTRSTKGSWSGTTGRACPSASGPPRAGSNSEHCRRERRYRRSRVSLEAERPVDMDWKEVDARRFSGATQEMKAALEGKLFAVVTDDENTAQLDECFREARELVDSASALLGCPQLTRERFNERFDEEFRIGSYVATVSRLNSLWAATCGVIEIMRMVRTWAELRKVFCSEDEQLPGDVGDVPNEEPLREDISASTSTLADMAFREGHHRRYDKRLELAEYSVAIAESIKLWLSIVPWRVRILYGGEQLISMLGAQEGALPWPPDPESDYKLLGDSDQKAMGCIGSEAMSIPVLRPGPEQCLPPCIGGDGDVHSSGDVKLLIEEDELHPSDVVQLEHMDPTGTTSAVCTPSPHVSFGRRLRTVTVEAEAAISCSEMLDLDFFPEAPHNHTRPHYQGRACLHCGRPALRLPPSCCTNNSVEPPGKAHCMRNFLLSGHDNDNPVLIQGTFPGRLRDLLVLLQSEFKELRATRALCNILPIDLVGMCSARSKEEDELSTRKIEGPDLGARIGILVFFRLLGSLQRHKNTRGILKLIRKVPSMIANTPVLALSPQSPMRVPSQQEQTKNGLTTVLTDVTARASLGGVVEAIMSAAEGLLASEHELSGKEQGEVLGALVGLAIKRGSLTHCLQVVKLLCCLASMDNRLPVPGVGHHLKELEATQPCNRSQGGAGAKGNNASLLYVDHDSYETGVLMSCRETKKQTTEGNCREVSIPPALRGVQVLKVDRTTSHHVAITADGELLTWCCGCEMMEQADNTGYMAPPSPMLYQHHGIPVWQSGVHHSLNHSPAEWHCACTGCSASLSSLMSGDPGVDARHQGSARSFLRVLANKQAVADVACGQRHTIALLVTGEVLSWGGGGSGRLGLGDTHDRAFACHVEAIQGIQIEAVFCGVSHSMAVASTGAAYTWGNNESGQCGHGGSVASVAVLSPRVVEGLKGVRVTAMAGGWAHTLALTRCGQVFSFGGGYKGGCMGEAPPVRGISAAPTTEGRLNEQDFAAPTKVCEGGLSSARVTAIASGWDHCMAITDDGSLFTWGSGRGGQLGHGDTEPRPIPTCVDYFATPAGGSVCSAAGGRSYSAVVTADGRLFKWGLDTRHNLVRMGEVVSDGRGGESRDGSPNESSTKAAMEASVPGHVREVGAEGSGAVRLGGGAYFDLVLVQGTSTADPSSPPAGLLKGPKSNSCSTKEMLATVGLAVPDDPSQPVGRIEAAVVILRHLERLAVPHAPVDLTADVDRSVRRARRVCKRAKKRMEPETKLAEVVLATCTDESSSIDQQSNTLKTVSGCNPQERSSILAGPAPVGSVEEKIMASDASAIADGASSPVLPFCVDASLKAFCAFLDLINGMRQERGPTADATATGPAICQRDDSSTSISGKRIERHLNVTGRVNNNGPESSPCGEPSPGYNETDTFREEPTSKRAENAEISNCGFAPASRRIKLEAMRCTLKLLRVNLFHLARTAAIRRCCRVSDDGEDAKISPTDDDSTKQAPTIFEPRGAQVHGCFDPLDDSAIAGGSTRKHDSGETVWGTDDVMPGIQGPSCTLEGSSGEGRHLGCKHAEDMHRIIEELHVSLRVLLEEGTTEDDPETSKLSQAVRIEAAEAFRTGFSIFFPSNQTRVGLLREIVRGLTNAGSVFTPGEIREGSKQGDKLQRSHPKANRQHITPKPESTLLQVAVEGLAREKYAAALVAEAFVGDAEAGTEGSNENSMGRRQEIGDGSREAWERLDAAELDSIMRSLLSYCTNSLHHRLSRTCTNVGESGPQGGSSAETFPGGGAEQYGCPYTRLLIVLQTHMVAYWGDIDGDPVRTSAARELSLAHAVRLFEGSLQVFANLLKGIKQAGGRGPDTRRAVMNSFVALVPLLCASIAVLPAKGGGRMSRAAALLPLVVPLVVAVDRFNHLHAPNAIGQAGDGIFPPSKPCLANATLTRWMTGLEEALAMLSADLVCGLAEKDAIRAPRAVGLSSHTSCSGMDIGGGCNDGVDQNQRKDERTEDVVELLLRSSSFLANGRESFDWPSLADGACSQPDSPDYAQALEVITWQERATQEPCCCSEPPLARTQAPMPTPSNPKLNRENPHHSITRGHRRSSSDNAKLSPLETYISADGKSWSFNAATRGSGPVGNSGFGGESVASGNQGSARAAARIEGEGNDGRKGSASSVRQLDSIVDEARAEGFIQDLLYGRGTAQALYQWMTVPPDSQLPVLHATSLATQGQGWGSYQSLGSNSASVLAGDQEECHNSQRRRCSRALSSDVDAATRALVVVMVKSNGLVTEAATFARCRLDRASSPPPALKLVAAAAGEVREALAGLADSLGEEQDARKRGAIKGSCCQREAAGGRDCQEDLDLFSLTATLATIVRNCRFLLKCTCLPTVNLARNRCHNFGRQRSASRLHADHQQIRRVLSNTLGRWATEARDGMKAVAPKLCRASDPGSAEKLMFIVGQMAKGRVRQALSASMMAQTSPLHSRSASLDSLVSFAASPVLLDELEARMGTHDLRAKVRASCFRLVHYMLHEVKTPAALRQIGARFACLLQRTADDVDKPSMFEGIGGGGHATADLVYSAYVEVFRHVAHQVRQEHERLKAQDGEPRHWGSLLVYLPLLRTLAKMPTPSFLQNAATTSTSENQPARGITDRTPASSPGGTEQVSSGSVSNPQWPGQTSLASSTSSIMQTDANVVPASPHLTKIGATSVVATVLPVLGAIIGDEGDVLTPDAWDPGHGCKHASIHHAAWWALRALSAQLCISAPASTRHANGSLHHTGQTGGRRSPSSTEKNRQAIAEGVKEWWAAVQALLSVLSGEAARAQKRLEQLVRSRHAIEETLAATGARQLVTGVALLPFTVTLASPEPLHEGGGNGEASTFWIWVPDCVAQQPYVSCDVTQGLNKSTKRSASSESGWRTKICTPAYEEWSARGANTGVTGSPGVFLTWLPLDEHTQEPEITKDGGGFRVEILFLTRVSSKCPTLSNEAQGCAIGETILRADRARVTNTAISKGDEGSGGQAVVADRIISDCSLRMGRWTHVCCVYTSSEGEVATSTSGDGAGETTSSSDRVATMLFNGRVVATGILRASEIGCASDTVQAAQKATLRTELGVGNRNGEITGETLIFTEGKPPAREQWQGRPVVCDLHWHPRKVSQDEAKKMSDNGIPAQREDEQLAAECYVTRLVALVHDFFRSAPRAAVALSSPRWLSLWLKLMPVAGQHAQKAIVRLLRPLLCVPNQTAGDGVEDVSAKSQTPSGRSIPTRPPGQGVGDRAVVEHLCGLLGRSLLPLLHRRSGCLVGVGDSEMTSAVSGQGYRSSRSNPVQEPSMVSELVFLLRGLVEEASTRWQDRIFSLLASGLMKAAKGELIGLSPASSAVNYKTLVDSEIGAHMDRDVQTLGAALAAVYLGGGLLPAPHLGTTTVLLPCPDHRSAMPSNALEGRDPEDTKSEEVRVNCVIPNIYTTAGDVVFTEEVTSTCRGSAIGWTGSQRVDPACHNGMLLVDVDEQYRGCVGTVSLHNVASHRKWPVLKGSQLSAVASTRRVVAAPFRQVAWQAETAEPMTPFLMKLVLPDILATLESSASPNANGTPVPHKSPGRGVFYASGENVVAAHLRCRMIRALAVQLRNPDNALTALQGRMLPILLAIATSNLASAVVVALGSDGAVTFGRRREFAAVVLALSHDHLTTNETSMSRLAHMEAACRMVWSRLSMGKAEQELRGARWTARPGNTTKYGESDSGVCVRRPHPTLQVLGGEAMVEGNRVTSSSHFPTIRLSDVKVGLGSINGRWYYEVTLLTGGLMQLGWAGPSFECSPVRGQGVGDHAHSWAFDGFRQKRWCVSSAPYGKRWQAGDVVGVFLDTGLQEMRFSLNGRDLGVAFVGFDTEGLYPAASMNVGQAAHFNFGYSPFLYNPMDSGASSFQPITEAVSATVAVHSDSIDNNTGVESFQAYQERTPMRPSDPLMAGGDVDGDDVDEGANGDVRRGIDEFSSRRDRERRGSGGDTEGRQGDNRSNNYGGSGNGVGATDGAGGGDAHLELQRQGLVENLIVMGFPVEWAMRAAERSGTVMSESAATAWIIQRLEIENTKMEEDMGNMGACEEESAGGNSGCDEYNDDTRESDEGDEPGGFAYASEAAGLESGGRGVARRIAEDTGDRRWRDMYSAVRRSFLARNGESPATAAALRMDQHGPSADTAPGAAAESAQAENALCASAAAATLRGSDGYAAREGVQQSETTPQGLLQVVYSAEEEDLPSLSLVLDTALSTILARVAVVNLLSHVWESGSDLPKRGRHCPRRLSAGLTEDSNTGSSKQQQTTKVCSGTDDIVRAMPHLSSNGHAMGADEGGSGNVAAVAMTVPRGVLETMAAPEYQRLLVDFTKVLTPWQSTLRPLPTSTAHHTPVFSPETPSGKRRNVLGGFSETLEEDVHCGNAGDPFGLHPRTCFMAMLSILDLAMAPTEHLAGRGGTALPAKPSSSPNAKCDTRPASSPQTCAGGSPAPMHVFIRFVGIFISEAVSVLEKGLALDSAGAQGGNAPLAEQAAGEDKGEPLSPRSNAPWALWVIETLLFLESTRRGMGWPTLRVSEQVSSSIGRNQPFFWTASYLQAGGVTGDAKSMALAVAPAPSSQTFAAVFQSAFRCNLDETTRTSAFCLCCHMLNLSRCAAPIVGLPFEDHLAMDAATEATSATEVSYNNGKCVPMPKDEYTLPSQERALAQAFSARLRSEIGTHTMASPLLQSQLELLAQWQLQRSPAAGERGSGRANKCRQHDQEWKIEDPGIGEPPSCRVSNRIDRTEFNSWDVATAVLAGVETAGDVFERAHKKKPRAVGSRRPGTMGSDASALSNVPGMLWSGNISSAHGTKMLVENATATSVTVSWGGWLGTDHVAELQVGVAGDGVAYPVSFGKAAGTSDLAQALRSRLKDAASRRQEQGPSLVLKVRTSGLWGWEPFRVVALDLETSGCRKVHDLVADTRYHFRIERREASASPRTLPPDGGETSDDEQSCFPSAATIGENSVGESTANPHGTDGGSSVLTGLDGSRSGGCGGASIFSEGYTTVHTDEGRTQGHASCCSSTRAVAGRHRSRSPAELYVHTHTVDGEEWQWPSMGGRQRSHGMSQGPSTAVADGEECTTDRTEWTVVATLCVATPAEVPFTLDAEGCGPNLRLANSNLTVTNTGRKKWSAVRATRCLSSGVHKWKVHIDRCISKNVFVGVLSSESSLNNYVGSDRSGWGYLANKAIWHNKGKVRSYGDLFREGDTIGVTLNMDRGTLRFSRNGRDLGVAVQDLEGTLYPAFSMYNRGDQLTLVPPDDHATCVLGPPSVAYGDEKRGGTPPRVGSNVDITKTSSNALYGTFSAECVVRRASKALEVLGILIEDCGIESPAGIHLVKDIKAYLLRWSKGEHGRLLSSANALPVRLDTSQQVRQDFCGLGIGDRVMSAEGEATVLGATRHTMWVSVEAAAPSSPSSTGLDRGTRAWDSELFSERQDNVNQHRRHMSSVVAPIARAPCRSGAGQGESRTMSWSRCMVRHIIGRPEDYVISRGATPVNSLECPTSSKSASGGSDNNVEHGVDVAASIVALLDTDQFRSVLSKWTREMDEELSRRLDKLAKSSAVLSPLDLPFNTLENLPASAELFPLTASLATAEVWARATVLLYVNDLVLPLLPLVDASRDGRGPLGALVYKCRHLIITEAKLSLLRTMIRPPTAVAPSESGGENASTFTISLAGIKALPTSAAVIDAHSHEFNCTRVSWAQKSKAVETSVFGQVAQQLTCSRRQVSDGPMAFSVKLNDASTLIEDDTNTTLKQSDTHALYRGVFWQVFAEAFSPLLSMFVPPPHSVTENTSAGVATAPAAPTSTTAADDNNAATPKVAACLEDKVDALRSPLSLMDCGAAPDPLFTSNLQFSSVHVDPERVALYRSLGFIAGLAVRTNVPLPILRTLTPRWWMLVAREENTVADCVEEDGARPAVPIGNLVFSKAGELLRMKAPWSSSYTGGASSNPLAKDGATDSSVNRVLAALGRLGEVEPGSQEELDELLADARFVAPLSNGQMVELFPGGADRLVTRDNLDEYRVMIARLRASEYTPHTDAFKTGLEAALPHRVLSLLTWREMGELICGGDSRTWRTW